MDSKTIKMLIIPVGIIIACLYFAIQNNFSSYQPISQNNLSSSFSNFSSQNFGTNQVSSTSFSIGTDSLNQNLEKISFDFSGQKITLEVAKTFSQREIGLMNRKSLEKNSGMLFVFEKPQKLAFWMKNTLIPLDIIFLDSGFNILNIETALPQPGVSDKDLKNYFSSGVAQYVIELGEGGANNLGLKPGEKLNLGNF